MNATPQAIDLTELLRSEFGNRTGGAWPDVARAIINAGWTLAAPGQSVTDAAKHLVADRLLLFKDTAPLADLEDFAEAIAAFAAAQVAAERERILNTPELHDFTAGVTLEALHQRERWGDAHDRSKSAENWFWLVGYLAGKALRAAMTGDKDKALHHTISAAAALSQWHAAIKSDETNCGLGQDADLKPATVSP